MITLGVIGYGYWGPNLVRNFLEVPGGRVGFVTDLRSTRLAQATARYPSVKVSTDHRDLIKDPSVDAVAIATPVSSHFDLAMEALRAGKHVLVEKPMTIDLAEADRMVAAARETGRTLACVFQRRWWPAAQRLRAAIDAGKIGAPVLGRCSLSWWRTQAYYARDAWRGRWDTEGGGVLVNQGIHAIDMFQWLMGGEPEEVVGRWSNQTHPYIEVEDSAAAIVRFRGGALGVLSATTSARLSQNAIVVDGSKGHTVGVVEEPEGAVGYNHVWTIPGEEEVAARSLAEHVAAGEYIYQAGPGLTAGPEEGHYWPTDYRYRRPASPNYHARQIADLVAAIRAGRRPLVDAVEGRKSVAILLAIYESGRTGLPVRVDAPVVA